jgi:hypothetical protein
VSRCRTPSACRVSRRWPTHVTRAA